MWLLMYFLTNNFCFIFFMQVIEEMKDVPATNIDDVSVSVDKPETPSAPTPRQWKPPVVDEMDHNQEPSHEPRPAQVKERERQTTETTCNSSDMSSRESNHSGVPGQAVKTLPSGVPPPQGTLADLKKQRLAQLQTNLQKKEHHTSSNGNGSIAVTQNNPVLPQNGHSPNLSGDRSAPSTPTNVYFPPPPQGDPPKRRFTATQPSEIVGNDGKQNCCVIV